MKKRIRKIATYCLLGFLLFMEKTMIAEAEIPIAGIDVVLNDFYNNAPNANAEIKELLNPVDSIYKDIAIVQVTDYVNIRSKASEKSDILGKLYNNSAATILSEEGDWYQVESGTVTGYVKSEYFVIGNEVEELAKTVGKRLAVVSSTTLKVRDAASLDASVQTLVPSGEELLVKKELDDWVKVTIDNDKVGYVSADYVEMKTEFDEAESIEEERARLEKETIGESEEESRVNTTAKSEAVSSSSYTSNSSSASSIRNNIVEYALKFEGNPYVWGGTSLTNGADCSGFTQSVFRDKGISISRTSRTQANSGREISLENIQPGDLIFYAKNGTINHVVIYIGNGKVIGASNPELGIKISNYTYRQPYKVINYID